MPKYLIKVDFKLGMKEDTKIIDIEAGNIKKAKQMAANHVYNSFDAKEMKQFKVTRLDHVRFRDKKRHMTSNQRKRLERAERSNT